MDVMDSFPCPPREILHAALTEEQCYAALRQLRWPAGIICPGCGGGRVTTHTNPAASPRRRYLCLACRRTFTDLTGTSFAHTKLPLRSWLLYLRLRASGCRTAELAKGLGVKWDTIAAMTRRLGGPPGRSVLAKQLYDALAPSRTSA